MGVGYLGLGCRGRYASYWNAVLLLCSLSMQYIDKTTIPFNSQTFYSTEAIGFAEGSSRTTRLRGF